MKGFDVLKIKSAVKDRNVFDLSHSHLTTMDFGQIIPLLAEETIPGDEFTIDGDYFSRMAPLVKPTYGRFSFKTVNAFVPYYMIAEDADAWILGKTSWEGTTPHHRFITVKNLANYIIDHCITTEGATADNCDFVYVGPAAEVNYCLFTQDGKYYVKILNCLGYSLPQGVNLSDGNTWENGPGRVKLSMYPLLAFLKLYNDYMSQSQRYNTSLLSSLLHDVRRNNSAVGYTASTGEFTGLFLNAVLPLVKLNYENGYFTSAWQTPNNAIGTSDTITEVSVPIYNDESTYDITPYTVKSNNNDNVMGADWTVIGQRALDFLKDFDNWVRRNNYSGSRAVQQIYSRFGIKTDDYRSHYAQVISTEELPVQVGDITSQADTDGASLGDYAGKGIMSGSKSFTVKCSDYGVVLVLGYFTVDPMYSFGYDRKVLRNSPLDYYTPEFDGLGAESISVGEVWTSPIIDASTTTDTTKDTDVFGFTERYNSYRFGRDQITGEFRNYHKDGDMNVWHTGRNLADIRKAGSLVAQSSSVNTLAQSDSEYNRIFSITDGSIDHFYLTCRFRVKAVRPMLNLNQVPGLGVGDTTVPRNGNVIS